MCDKISALLDSPNSKLLTKSQRRQLTKLCAQASSPAGLAVSNSQPKVLSEIIVEVQDAKTASNSDPDAARAHFDARATAIFEEVAAQASITRVENEWLDPGLINQQVLACTPLGYTYELHCALSGEL